MAVVCIHAEPTQEPWKEGEPLLPLRLKPLDVRARAIDRLRQLISLARVVVIVDE
jgi:hypothetical protein